MSFKIRCLSQRFQAIRILNLNLLQQVEMWLRHVYFCHCHAHVPYVILSKKFPPLEDLTLSILAYTTGTTSRHQRVMWPELLKDNSIPTHCGVAYESVRSLATCLRLQCRMLQRYQKCSKNAFLLRFLKIRFQNIVTANRWRCNMHVIL